MKYFLYCFSALLLGCSEPPAEPESLQSMYRANSVDTVVLTPAAEKSQDSFVLLANDISALPPSGQDSQSRNREEIAAFAEQFMGTPYVYAAADPQKGFDCSGFIYYVYQHFNIPVPRSSIGFKNYGREVALEKAQIGDLILFTSPTDSTRIGHIGIIYKPDNNNTGFIHASSGEAMAVIHSAMSSAHYAKRFVKVVDVISR